MSLGHIIPFVRHFASSKIFGPTIRIVKEDSEEIRATGAPKYIKNSSYARNLSCICGNKKSRVFFCSVEIYNAQQIILWEFFFEVSYSNDCPNFLPRFLNGRDCIVVTGKSERQTNKFSCRGLPWLN